MRLSITLAAALAATVAGIGHASATTTYTTIMYEAGSASSDIDVSCKAFSVASTGVLSATCNYEKADKSIATKATTSDLDTVLGCDGNGNLAWAETDLPDVVLDSTGDDYLLEADCEAWGTNTSTDDATIDLGDTTSGLKNEGGALKKR